MDSLWAQHFLKAPLRGGRRCAPLERHVRGRGRSPQTHRVENVGSKPQSWHIRTCGAYVKTKGKRGPGSGFSLTAHQVQADGTETLVLAASGAVPAVAT